MSEKLTAKLSDGTEWEVVEKWIADGPGCVRCSLKPLKPSPPKEVYVDVYASNKVSAAYVADELPSVDSDIRTRLVRYTLAPEPETTRERLTKISGVRDLSPFAALDKSLCATVEIDKDAIASSLKKPAREWWEVRYRDDTNAVNSFSSKERAEGFMAHFGSALDSYEIVHVREVVNEQA